MTVTSFAYLLLLLTGVLVYYLIPGKCQWIILLGMSVVFYCCAATPYTIVCLIISTFLAYFSTVLMENEKIKCTERGKKTVLIVTVISIVGNILLWFLLKGSSFWIAGTTVLNHLIPSMKILPALPIAAAMGMGYYTAQIIGYILDCYWENVRAQKNILKLFLFVCFFPQLTVGPISRYSQLETLYQKHKFSYDNLCMGSQRILWGFFKKLVIADRVGIIVEGIWADTIVYGGFWPCIAVLLYPLQMYADFSGCVDIVLGTAELFDIHLPENFNNPFFARNCQEFWQRWHITLGNWARDYVYYPVLKSKPIIKIGKWSKKHFKKRIAKLIPWTLGMGILWFVMGFWHGSVQHILGVGLWFWLILVISELCSPILKKMVNFFKINTESFSWRLFQGIRTYILYAFGAVFFSVPEFTASFNRYKELLQVFQNPNPWIFFDGSVLNLGVSWRDINLIIIGVLLLLVVAVLREKYGYARTWMQKQILPFRWLVWVGLFVLVLIYGLYGPGYDASAFIYEGF